MPRALTSKGHVRRALRGEPTDRDPSTPPFIKDAITAAIVFNTRLTVMRPIFGVSSAASLSPNHVGNEGLDHLYVHAQAGRS